MHDNWYSEDDASRQHLIGFHYSPNNQNEWVSHNVYDNHLMERRVHSSFADISHCTINQPNTNRMSEICDHEDYAYDLDNNCEYNKTFGIEDDMMMSLHAYSFPETSHSIASCGDADQLGLDDTALETKEGEGHENKGSNNGFWKPRKGY